MPLPSRSFLLLAVLLASASTAAIAAPQHGHGRKAPPQQQAQRQDDGEEARGPRARRDDALSESIRRVERNTRGKVLSAEQVPYDGRSLNRVKIVDGRGRVRVYMDDPQAPKPPQRAAPTRGDDD